ncbi:MAG: RNA polymerase sigma factor [Solirubrobacteraceae bacterium]
MEASALPATVGLARPRIAISTSLLRLRSDEQLVTLFRDGNEDAFRIIHDRYRGRLLAYARQMLSASGQDSEDALQEVFVRAYYGLRADHRDLALRPWLYRVAHNRCVDVLRHNQTIPVDPAVARTPDQQDPAARAEQRDALRRLIADVRRLPEQQRSALLMRELSGMSYGDVAGALGVSVPAVKSLLVRARVGLAAASEARNTACAQIREDLILSHDRGVRASGLARRHLHECPGCREFRSEVRGVSRQLAALAPTLGPIGVIANLLGIGGGGSAAAGSGVAGGSAAAAGTGAAASAGLLAGGAGHVVTLLAAAVVTAGGAVEIQRTLSAPLPHRVHHRAARVDNDHSVGAIAAAQATAGGTTPASMAAAFGAGLPAPPLAASTSAAAGTAATYGAHLLARGPHSVPISQSLDPDHLLYSTGSPAGSSTGTGSPSLPGLTTPGSGPPPGTGIPAGTGTGAGSGPSGAPTGTTPGPGPAGTPTGTGSPTGSGSPGTTASTPNPAAGSGTPAPTSGSTGTPAPSSSGASTSTGAPGTTSSTAIGKTVGAGAGSGGHVIRLVTAKRQIRHHGFALGTLLAR